MKILYFIKGLGLGGAERHVVDCAVAARDAGEEVHVCYLLSHKDHFVPELKSAGIPVKLVGNNPFSVSRYLAALNPDVVHAHLPVPAFYSRLLRPFFSYGLVVTHHNMFGRQKRAVRLSERILHGIDDVGISCSGEVSLSLPWETVTIDNGIVIPENIEPPQAGLRDKLGLSDSAVIILCIANLVPKKNHALLCRAFTEVERQIDTECHCVLIGQDGTERRRLETLVNELGCSNCIHFWGPDANAAKLAADADIFCLTSDFEGLPLSLLEAMSAGLPVVVTDAGGMPSVVEDGVHGRVVARGNQKQLVAALTELCLDKALRIRFGEQARSHVAKKYDVRTMFDRLSLIYSRVARGRAAK